MPVYVYRVYATKKEETKHIILMIVDVGTSYYIQCQVYGPSKKTYCAFVYSKLVSFCELCQIHLHAKVQLIQNVLLNCCLASFGLV